MSKKVEGKLMQSGNRPQASTIGINLIPEKKPIDDIDSARQSDTVKMLFGFNLICTSDKGFRAWRFVPISLIHAGRHSEENCRSEVRHCNE
jgi:hypothetical protein